MLKTNWEIWHHPPASVEWGIWLEVPLNEQISLDLLLWAASCLEHRLASRCFMEYLTGNANMACTDFTSWFFWWSTHKFYTLDVLCSCKWLHFLDNIFRGHPSKYLLTVNRTALVVSFLWGLLCSTFFGSFGPWEALEAPGAPRPRGSGYKLPSYTLPSAYSEFSMVKSPRVPQQTENPCDFCWEIHCKQGPENLAAEHMACGLFLSKTLQFSIALQSIQYIHTKSRNYI